MSGNVVRVGAFLCVIPLALLAARAFSDGTPQEGAGGDRPLSPEPKPAASKPSSYAAPDKPKPSAAATKPGSASKAKPGPESLVKVHGGEKAIVMALKEEASLEFTETPLKDVIADVSKKHRIPILFEAAGLKDANVDLDTPITCQLSGISLRSALEIILDELQLTWVIHHDVLMITSPTKAESDEFKYTKVYDVTDLLQPSRSFAEGGVLGESPRAIEHAPPGSSAMDRVASDLNPLMDAIRNALSSTSWVDNGGSGTIHELDSMLVVNQTREVHAQIERFLVDVRARRNLERTLSVELRWLWLDAKHRDQLFAVDTKCKTGVSQTLPLQLLHRVADEVPHFHAEVGCVNGVGMVIASGDRRSLITGAVPVVGSGIGYSPVTSISNVGITAKVRPTVTADGKAAMLFVQSTITRWTPARPPAIVGSAWPAEQSSQVEAQAAPTPFLQVEKEEKTASGSGSCPVDLPVMPTQEFGTTLRVPLGKPVVVGSITFDPAGGAGLGEARADPVEVYLIATTSLVKPAAESAAKGDTKSKTGNPLPMTYSNAK